jgi:Dolichyl-phosphate-mannose-protein mannosyltransferase
MATAAISADPSPRQSIGSASPFSSARVLVGGLALVKLAVHLATAAVYGFFIDELYFLACGEHLAWGYVDFPPLTAFQAWLTRHLFGDSPYSIRLFPALAGAALVWLTGALARQFGGGRLAQGLAALVALVAPVYLAFSSYLSMNSIEPVVWTACVLVVVRMIQTGDTRLWIAFGLLSGVGLLNKHTMAVFAFALVAGLLLTPERRLLKTPWLLVGGAFAFVIVLPNLVWEIRHGFPHLELLANIRSDGRDVDVGFLKFWGLEVLFLQPLAAPVWVLGLVALFRHPALRQVRALGWTYLITLITVVLTTQGSHKTYYLAPAYPMLIAAGAVVLEEWLARKGLRWVRPAYAFVLGAAGALLAPTIMPLLSPEAYLRFTNALGIGQPRLENRSTNAMPQFFADRLGWPEMVEKVARAYHALPEPERVKTGIFANDYGQGGAIDFYGPRYGLPKAIGGHLTYWYWGPRQYTGESLIVLGDRREVLEREFEEVLAVGETNHPYSMRDEHFTIFLCRRPRGFTLQSIWPRLKRWH